MFEQVLFTQPAAGQVFGHLRRHSYKNNNEESETRKKLALPPRILPQDTCKKFVGLGGATVALG